MGVKRVVSGLLGFPIIMLVVILGNQYLIDVLFSAIALIAVHEFYSVFKEKAKPIRWVGYICAFSIVFMHILPTSYIGFIVPLTIPTILLVLFLQVIITNQKTNFYDITITFVGIAYTVIFTMFIPMIRALSDGDILIWYLILAAWGTDVFAYCVGKIFGKHKFTKVSPNKTIEGCIGGVVGAVITLLVYNIAVNKYLGLNIGYLYIVTVSILSSIVAQIGDLAASSIKRYTGAKDFGNLIPGHGGILDRFDSMIFIAPFMYAILSML